ncbi:hypothetical protein [Labrys neptuniae]
MIDAEILQYRATLALAVKGHVTHADLTSDQAARLFGVDRDRMLDLLGSRIADFEFGDPVQMMNEADLDLPPLDATGVVVFPKALLDRAVALTEGMTVNLDDEIEGDVSI